MKQAADKDNGQRMNESFAVLITAPVEDGSGHMCARFAVFDGPKFAGWTSQPLAATVFPSPRIAVLAGKAAAQQGAMEDAPEHETMFAVVSTPDPFQPVNIFSRN